MNAYLRHNLFVTEQTNRTKLDTKEIIIEDEKIDLNSK